ncbi:hypothetical protein WDU94_013501 [Cyamophila willieti]
MVDFQNGPNKSSTNHFKGMGCVNRDQGCCQTKDVTNKLAHKKNQLKNCSKAIQLLNPLTPRLHSWKSRNDSSQVRQLLCYNNNMHDGNVRGKSHSHIKAELSVIDSKRKSGKKRRSLFKKADKNRVPFEKNNAEINEHKHANSDAQNLKIQHNDKDVCRLQHVLIPGLREKSFRRNKPSKVPNNGTTKKNIYTSCSKSKRNKKKLSRPKIVKSACKSINTETHLNSILQCSKLRQNLDLSTCHCKSFFKEFPFVKENITNNKICPSIANVNQEVNFHKIKQNFNTLRDCYDTENAKQGGYLEQNPDLPFHNQPCHFRQVSPMRSDRLEQVSLSQINPLYEQSLESVIQFLNVKYSLRENLY